MPKNPAAVALGQLGGKASAASLTKDERIARAKKAVAAREAKRKDLLEKLVAPNNHENK